MALQNLASDPCQWPVGTSTALFTHFSDEELQACAKAGITHIELGIAGAWPGTADGYAALAERANAIKAAGLQLWSVHLPFGTKWDFTSSDAALRNEVIRIFTETLQHAARAGAGRAVIHPSWEPIAVEQRAGAFQRSKEALHQLADVAAANGITLAVECLPRTCLGNSSAEILGLLEGSSTLQVCMDANHLLTEKTEDFIRQVGSRIVTVHMSDYDMVNERHWLPGKGINNWSAIIGELAKSGYRGPFLYEVTQKSAGPVTAQDLVDCWHGLLNNYLAQQ